jgi:hypothetical protein
VGISNQSFWKSIRTLARRDKSVDPPESAVNAVLRIFTPRATPERRYLFQLQPSFLGAVRRDSAAKKFSYRLGDDMMVQMEALRESKGWRLSGFVIGIECAEVAIHGDSYFAETALVDGNFQFEALPSGTYALSFTRDEEAFWITDLNPETIS